MKSEIRVKSYVRFKTEVGTAGISKTESEQDSN